MDEEEEKVGGLDERGNEGRIKRGCNLDWLEGERRG
jgi:hypothetical protein